MGILACVVRAESAEYTDSVVNLAEISVTAIKTGSELDRQPVSAITLNRDRVEENKVVSARSATMLAPNIVIPDYGSRITSTIYARGLGARIDQPVVGLNIDNVPIINKDNYDFDLADIASVEVVNGPQSTLYGRNTMGGVINIRTLSPIDYQGVRIIGEYGSANTFIAGASIYHKVNQKFGLSLSLAANGTSGFYTNEFNGKKCDHEKQYSARAKFYHRPNAKFNIENVAWVTVSRQGGYPYEYVGDDPEFAMQKGIIAYNDTCFYRRTTFADGLTISYKERDWQASSITSVQHIHDNMTLDQDFSMLPYFTLTQKKNEWAVTQDCVVRSTSKRAYQWLGGLFGFYRHNDMTAPVRFYDYGIDQLILKNIRSAWGDNYDIYWDDDHLLLNSDFTLQTWGVALYHQSSYQLGDFTFTAGIRGDFERSDLRYHSNCDTGCNFLYIPTQKLYKEHYVINDRDNLHKSFWQILPKFSVEYEFSCGRLYASASKGYKAGGFNTQMFSDVLQQRLMEEMGASKKYDIEDVIAYKPEKAWTYEVGAKLNFFNHKLNINASLFYIDCTDQQITVFPDGTTTGRIMTNAGQTRSFGGEMTLRAITGNVEWNASYGYTNAKFVKFNNGISDFSGKYVPYAPSNTIFAQGIYTLPINAKILRSIKFDAHVNCLGKIYWNEENTVSQPLYAQLGVNITLENKNYSLSVWGENITNTKFSTFYFVSIQHEFVQRGRPRRFGATLRLNF